MIAIIPALLRTPEDVRELGATLASIPVDLVAKCIVASKGLEPDAAEAPSGREYVWLRSDVATTKWGSIALGVKELGKTDEYVLLIDADDPFEGGSLQEFCAYVETAQADCVVGRRDRVILVADDQRTPRTRLFIEVFSNTLLLAKLGKLPERGADIQSGLYALPAGVLRGLSFEKVKMYGGELTLYHQLAAVGARIEEKTVRAHEVLESSYRSSDIFRAIFELPFFADVSDKDIEAALREGPRLYAEWMPEAEEEYREEIRALLGR